jgi:hypothetical protein
MRELIAIVNFNASIQLTRAPKNCEARWESWKMFRHRGLSCAHSINLASMHLSHGDCVAFCLHTLIELESLLIKAQRISFS